MVGVAIIGILGVIAAPNLTGLMLRSTVRTLSSDLGADLNFARSEAVRLGSAVSICPAADAEGSSCSTANQWNNGWIVFRESPASTDGVIGSGETVLRQHTATPSSDYTITRTGTGNGAVTFIASGATRTGAEVTLTISHPRTASRRLVVSVIGRLSTTLVH